MNQQISTLSSTIFVTLLFLLVSGSLSANNFYWEAVDEANIEVDGERQIVPNRYFPFHLDLDEMLKQLQYAPNEFDDLAFSKRSVIQLPMPDGSSVHFQMAHSPVMSDKLRSKYPAIDSWSGLSPDHPGMILRIDIGNLGFRGILSTPAGTIYYDAYSSNDLEHYICYYRSDYSGNGDPAMICHVEDEGHGQEADSNGIKAADNGDELRIFRMAMAATGEYSAFHGGTVDEALSAIVTTVNRINMVYMRDLSIKFELIDDNDEIIFLNGNTDPYSNNDGGAMLNQNAQTLGSIIGNSNYDIGHVVSTASGGIAFPGGVCTNNKARGTTGLFSPVGDPFDIDYVAHEVGHQMGGSHTFNGSTGSCSGGNLSPLNAYEPGSGSTIMAYAGLCSGQNIQGNSDDYFHVESINQIINRTNGNGGNCAQKVPTGNSNPSIFLDEGGWVIPAETPFVLTGNSVDSDISALTYCWEQYDLGDSGNPANPSGNDPLFRSFSPTSRNFRSVPDFTKLINGTFPAGEYNPDYDRDIRFQLTVRDNHPVSGGVDFEDLSFSVSTTPNPFTVAFPQEGETWAANEFRSIAWVIAGTDMPPVNCENVDIFLVYNDGEDFVTILENTPNNGSAFFNVPTVSCDDCRIMVKGSDNIFFNLNPGPFTITGPFNLGGVSEEKTICVSENDATFQISFQDNYDITGNVNLSVEGLPEGLTYELSSTTINEFPTAISLSVEAASYVESGIYPFQFIATNGSFGQLITDMSVEVINNAVDPIALNQPTNGADDLSGTQIFEWSEFSGASSYDWELALSPEFDVLTIAAADQLANTSYQYTGGFIDNTIYYWRVRGDNGCGEGNYSPIWAFRSELNQDVLSTPIRVNANNYVVGQNEEKTINGSHLLVTDPVTSLNNLVFTLTNLPIYGQLKLDGTTLLAGGTFTQQEINNGKLSYDHNGTAWPEDQFGFQVENAGNGWLPNETFEIEVDLTTGIEIENASILSVYPNPVDDFLFVELSEVYKDTREVNWSIENLVGQQVAKGESLIENGLFRISNIDHSAGIYMISLEMEGQRMTRKFIIE